MLENYSAQRLRLQYRSTVLSKMFYNDNDNLHHKVSCTATKMRKHTSEFLVDFDTAGEIHPLAVTMLLYPTAV